MTTAHASAQTSALPARLTYAVVGGLAGGVLFGALLQMMGMMPMIAQLVGASSAAVGWAVHLVNSAVIGAVFGLLLGAWATRVWVAALLGLAYGAAWWVLGAMLIMPAWLGMPVLQLSAASLQSLLGHLLYGLVLGLVFAGLARRRG